jgi:hypothetical protein
VDEIQEALLLPYRSGPGGALRLLHPLTPGLGELCRDLVGHQPMSEVFGPTGYLPLLIQSTQRSVAVAVPKVRRTQDPPRCRQVFRRMLE